MQHTLPRNGFGGAFLSRAKPVIFFMCFLMERGRGRLCFPHPAFSLSLCDSLFPLSFSSGGDAAAAAANGGCEGASGGGAPDAAATAAEEESSREQQQEAAASAAARLAQLERQRQEDQRRQIQDALNRQEKRFKIPFQKGKFPLFG